MTPEEILRSLLDGGVLAESESGRLHVSDEFRETLESADGDDGGTDTLTGDAAGVADRVEPDRLFELHFEALGEFVPSLDRQARARAAVTLGTFELSVPDAGSPATFIPVPGEQVPALLDVFDRAVVYVWREDCEPCDSVREALDAMFEDHRETVAPLSVYGPASAELLDREYDIGGAPTTLFVADERVVSRLTGPYDEPFIRTELEKLLDAS